MEYFKDDSNAEDVWTKEDLLKSTYEPGETGDWRLDLSITDNVGTFITNHFHVLEKTPQSLTIRACPYPRQDTPTPVHVDNMLELRVDLDKEKKVAVFQMKMITFEGGKGASQKPDPFGGFLGFLHRQYSLLLMQAATGHCMQ